MKRLLPVLLLLFAGCSKVTKENYDRLKVGMSYDEVVRILGKPTSCSDAVVLQSCVWGDEGRNITVNFIGRQAMLYTSKNIR